jgi:GT2 family glycosyltransferase
VTDARLAEAVFVAAATLVLYTYVGYPVLVWALGRLLPRHVRRAEILPSVSIVIAAHNEERVIAAKLENALALDYPSERLEVIVGSDCSTDETDAIVRAYASRGIMLRRLSERGGKTAAQQAAVEASTGDILLFSDANSLYRADAVRMVVRSFADPEVGCVVGRLVYSERSATGTTLGCLAYWKFETLLRSCESRLGSLVGASGCLYAVRRSSFVRLPCDLIDDFALPLEVRLQGLRTVYEPDAVGVEHANRSGESEFRMRVRVVHQTYRVLEHYRELLDPLEHGVFAVQLFSHKILRHLMPATLAVAFAANALLMRVDGLYEAAFYAQLAFYGAALAGAAAERVGLRARPIALPYYFVLANAASLVALARFLRGEVRVAWASARDADMP